LDAQTRAAQQNLVTSKAASPVNVELFERLRVLRRKLADAQNVLPYVVFTDVALHGMCATLPENDAELLAVPGVGQVKLEKYGKRFLQFIRGWRLEQENAGREIMLLRGQRIVFN
jgi:ATP-dependent DNA helicase RecQ